MSTPIALWLAEKLEDPESAHGYRLVANNAADELRRLHQENEQLKAQTEQSIGCQCPACLKTLHASDCAVHNAPAHPVGECDCGAQPYPENFIDALKYDVARRDSESAELTDWQERGMVAEAALAKLLDEKTESVVLPEKTYEFVPTPEPDKWHHPECEGECIACLIERVVQEAYGSQGLGYLQRHLTSPLPCPTCEALARTVMLDQTSHDAQRKPLPCETLRELWCNASLSNSGSGWFVVSEAFARAIEAAHGIKENT